MLWQHLLEFGIVGSALDHKQLSLRAHTIHKLLIPTLMDILAGFGDFHDVQAMRKSIELLGLSCHYSIFSSAHVMVDVFNIGHTQHTRLFMNAVKGLKIQWVESTVKVNAQLCSFM